MRCPIVLMLGLLALIAAGCATRRADLEAPHTTAAGPEQSEEAAEFHNVIEGIRPFAF